MGATYLPPGASAVGDREVATTCFLSGGGFSNIYLALSYQTSAINAFLSFESANTSYPGYNTSGINNLTPAEYGSGIFNSAGRGYPDFAAIGDNVAIVVDGKPQLIGGMSASTPVFAAILNRINEERLAVGKGTVGFVNPTLYANPQVFHDITTGNNSGCGTSGFYATAGWDPLTGLGTPDYEKLLELYMGLP